MIRRVPVPASASLCYRARCFGTNPAIGYLEEPVPVINEQPPTVRWGRLSFYCYFPAVVVSV
ncbi:MAG: hypothetical protein AAF581_14435, partial [Planctomycetota bacterium]